MKVFVSSVIGGFETFREAASDAVRSLGYEVIRAEDFGASPTSPQEACLASVRESRPRGTAARCQIRSEASVRVVGDA